MYDEAGNVVLDPDAQIRETISYFFETFSRVGSASQTVKVFRNEGLDFPSRLRGEETIFRPLTASTAMRTLHNPRYAGAYVYGRQRYRRSADGKKTIQRKREHGDWLACIPNAHPGYISWVQFQENLKVLETNGADTKWRAHRRHEKGPRCCKDVPSAADAEGISVSDMPRDEEGRRPGTSAIVD